MLDAKTPREMRRQLQKLYEDAGYRDVSVDMTRGKSHLKIRATNTHGVQVVHVCSGRESAHNRGVKNAVSRAMRDARLTARGVYE